jgi:hypothetical protein
MICRVKYIGKSFGVDGLTNNKIYDVISAEPPFIRIIDDSEEDYLYSLSKPSCLENPKLCGVWKIIEDPKGIIKENLEN